MKRAQSPRLLNRWHHSYTSALVNRIITKVKYWGYVAMHMTLISEMKMQADNEKQVKTAI
jgi:hypothetical protein